MPQTPTAYGYQFVNAFPGVTFDNPMALASPPGETNRLFIVERAGRIAVITNLASPNRTVYLDITSKMDTARDGGLQSMTFHPGFATNGRFYLFYTGQDTTPTPGGTNALHDILAGYHVPNPSTNRAAANTEQKLIRQHDRQGDHNGADLHFGPDGYLYVSVGDEGSPNAVGYDYYTNSQAIDRKFFSGLLRIDVDRHPENLAPNTHPAVVAGTYLVPADNPFVGATQFNGLPLNPAKVRTEFWAVGLRNPFRFSFDRETGALFLGDVGQKTYEEINLITRGGNYGWIFREGAHATPTITRPAPPGFTSIDPIYEYAYGTGANQGKCVIGGIVYRGRKLSQLYGCYVFADYSNARVWAFRWTGSGITNFQSLAAQASIVGFGTDPSNGDVLAADIASGTLWRLVYNTNSASGESIPNTLAATGVFTDAATLTPHAGLVPYDVNVSSWSDHALKSRWFSVPKTNQWITFSPNNNWAFPTGTVWVKHFELLFTNDVSSSARRLETRLLVKTRDGAYGVTYRWGNSTTNAVLVPEQGMDETFVIRNSNGSIARTQTWHYPARVECRLCHTPASGHALGFGTAQLNRDRNYSGTIENQLLALSTAGYFQQPIANTNDWPALAAATDTSATLTWRARSYLAANCAGCHRPGALSEQQAAWDGRPSTPLSQAGIINGPVADNFGDEAKRVVKLGSLNDSMLYQRIANVGPRHMPPLGTSLRDTQAIALVAQWITTPPSTRMRIKGSAAGRVALDVLGEFGWTCVVEASSNTTGAWTTAATNIVDGEGLATFQILSPTNAATHFFRAFSR